jgi:hypothetical protein
MLPLLLQLLPVSRRCMLRHRHQWPVFTLAMHPSMLLLPPTLLLLLLLLLPGVCQGIVIDVRAPWPSLVWLLTLLLLLLPGVC